LNKDEKLLAGICGVGTYILAKTEVLKDKKYTSPITEWTEKHKKVFGTEDPFQKENYIKARVMRDKNVITSVGEAFVDFAIEIRDWFKLFEDEEEKTGFMNYIKG
jgi:putative intracellular protease/amidase